MSVLQTTHPTLLDLAKAQDPDGTIATVVELLSQTNPILDQMTFVEGNLPTGHRTTVRTGIPKPTWRKMYQGVQPTKSLREQITDTCGMLEAYSEIDKAAADLNGNTAAFRLSEDRPFIEGINIELASTLFYGDESINPERFTGLAPRYSELTGAGNSDNVIDGGGTGSDNASIYLVVWGDQTCHGIIPKGSTAGLQFNDKGLVTVENAIDGNGGRMEAYRSHYRLDAGLTLKDWRYVVRICNIDRSALSPDKSTGADLTSLMIEAIERIPALTMGQPAFYADRSIITMMRQQQVKTIQGTTMTFDNIAGRRVASFDGIPVHRTDALAVDEARVV